MTTVAVELAHKIVVVEPDGDAIAVVVMEQPGRVVVVDDRLPGPPGPTGGQGPAGAPGVAGPPGPTGGTGPLSYEHDQTVPAATWHVAHFLGYDPAGIVVFDTAGTQWFANPDYLDLDHLDLVWPAAFAGKARMS